MKNCFFCHSREFFRYWIFKLIRRKPLKIGESRLVRYTDEGSIIEFGFPVFNVGEK